MKILKNIGVIVLSMGVFIFGELIQVLLQGLFSDYYLKIIIPCTARIIVTIVLACIISSKVLKISSEELGLKYKKSDIRLIILAIALPLTVLAFYAFVLPGKAYVAKEGTLAASIVYAIFYEGLKSGITEEIVFRGMIFRYMKKTLGLKAAIIIPAVLFAAAHISNMETFNLTDVILLILAGSSVSVMFTSMAHRSGTIYPGALAHTLWNAFIIGKVFGIGDIVNGQPNDSYIVIPIESGSKLLTGGNFGVEAALPGTICYAIVALIVFLLIRTKDAESKETNES